MEECKQLNAGRSDVPPPVPAGPESGIADFPRSWSGRLSDTSFTARNEDGEFVLGQMIDMSVPVLIQLRYSSPARLEEYAEAYDFGLAVARDPAAFQDAEIIRKALSLEICRDQYRASGNDMLNQLEARRGSLDPSPENLRTFGRNLDSAKSLCRIADRIEARLDAALGASAGSCGDAMSYDNYRGYLQ